MMSPYQVELLLILACAGEPARQFRIDPRCARIDGDKRLHVDHDRRSPDGITCQCREETL